MRKYEPLDADHPMVGNEQCAACRQTFSVGDVTTLVVVGPGDDAENREKARQGRAYNAVAVPAHYACVTGDED